MGRHSEPGRRRATSKGRPAPPVRPTGPRPTEPRPPRERPAGQRPGARDLLGWGAFAGPVAALAVRWTGRSWAIAGVVVAAGWLTLLVVAVAAAASGGRRSGPRS